MLKILNIIILINFLFSESKIIASDGDIDDRFGKAVSITNEWLAVGANRDDDVALNSGSVYLYKYNDDQIRTVKKVIRKIEMPMSPCNIAAKEILKYIQ